MNPASGAITQIMSHPPEAVSMLASVEALANSAALGMVLLCLTVWASNAVPKGSDEMVEGQKPLAPTDIIINSSNVLFICFGMTGMLLLVNNNIARAFAIAAAIALVRFKIKVDSKVMSMSLFYAVLTGMACGVGYSFIGYILVGFFGVLQFIVISAVRQAQNKNAAGRVKMQSSADMPLVLSPAPNQDQNV